MISTNNIPSNFANAISPFSGQGGNPVGQENPEARNTSFKPVEESAETARIQGRRETDELRDTPDTVEDRSQGEDQRREQEREQQAREERVSERQEAEDRREIDRLAARDREVRAHEQAHQTAGGNLAGAASFQYERGPDGVSYAVSGEVPIRLGSGNDNPREALEVARRVQRAALAPAEPSIQDRQVAAQAAQMEQEALRDIAELERQEQIQQREELQEEREAQRVEEQQQEQERELQAREEQQATAERERLERNSREQERLSEATSQLLDLNQRLIEIGVVRPVPDAGSLINSNV